MNANKTADLNTNYSCSLLSSSMPVFQNPLKNAHKANDYLPKSFNFIRTSAKLIQI